MKILYTKLFYKDLRKINDKNLKKEIENLIFKIKEIKSIDNLNNIKKMKGYDNYYRMRLSNYRLGLKKDKDTFILLRFLHRKDIYKYFP